MDEIIKELLKSNALEEYILQNLKLKVQCDHGTVRDVSLYFNDKPIKKKYDMPKLYGSCPD